MQTVTSDKFFETTVSYDATDIRGNRKRATAVYAVAASSFSEAEQAVLGEYSEAQNPEVARITIAPYCEARLSDNESYRFYRINAAETVIDEKYDRETVRRHSVLIQAVDLEHARAAFENHNPGDSELVSITETKISEVIQKD